MMLKHYCKMALSNLFTQRLYTIINMFGLAVGLGCCIMISLFVAHELSFDRHFTHVDRIYRISRDFFPGGDSTLELQTAGVSPQVAGLMEADFDQVEHAARMFEATFLVESEDIAATEKIYWADNALFDIFDFEWLSGNPESALSAPFSIVLTKTLAEKYFGDTDPVGETVMLNTYGPTRVAGVIADMPDASHFDFDMLASLSTLRALPEFGPDMFEDWSNNRFYTYLLLEEGADAGDIEQASGAFFDRHYRQDASISTGYSLTPLTDIHLHSNREGEMRAPGSMLTVYGFSAIAVFILLIACTNFMNLATARSGLRAKEVGIRKAVGAQRNQIIIQFLGESMILTLIATALGMMLVELALPIFNSLMQVEVDVKYRDVATLMPILLLFALSVGLASGSYPAFFLSAFRSARVLKGDVTRGRAATLFRKVIVVSQFSLTIGLFIATVVVFLQITHSRHVDLGYDQEHVLVLDGTAMSGFGDRWSSFKGALLSHPQINAVSRSAMTPGHSGPSGAGSVRYEGGALEGEQGVPFGLVDFDFFAVYGIESLAGRVFSEDYGADKMLAPDPDNPRTTASFVLNEMAARRFGWNPEEALGKWFEMSLGNRFEMSARGSIIGVVENTNYRSARDALEPMFYFIPPEEFSNRLPQASIRLSGTRLDDALAHISDSWEAAFPEQPIMRSFVNENTASLYLDEERQMKLLGCFAVLAIMVACMGLFGLASLATEQRKKEIGVRKVMGGSVWSIVMLLTNNFSKLVLISNVIAWPVAYIAMNRWLENFAYRIDLTPLIFIGSGLIALCIAWVTVGGTAAKAARAKPMLTLRYE